MKDLTLCTDFDDVIVCFVQKFIEFYKHLYPQTRLEMKDFFSYNFPEVLKMSADEVTQIMTEFYYSPFHEEIEIYPRVLDVLYFLKEKGFKTYIVTGRHKSTYNITYKLIERIIPHSLIEDIFFTSAHSDSFKINKSEVCKKIGSSVLVDDDPRHVFDCCSSGIETLVLSRPWNEYIILPLGARRIETWESVKKEVIKAYSL